MDKYAAANVLEYWQQNKQRRAMWKTCRIWSSNCVDIVDTIDICTEGSEEQIKYLEMDKSGIRVAHYYTELPKPEDLQLIIKRQMIIAQQGGRNFD